MEGRTEHKTELTSSFLDEGWTATCLCGWIGERQDTISAASYDSHSHREFEASRAAGETP